VQVELDRTRRAGLQAVQLEQGLLGHERIPGAHEADALGDGHHPHVDGVVHALGRRCGEGQGVPDPDLEPGELLLEQQDRAGGREVVEGAGHGADHLTEAGLPPDLQAAEDQVHRPARLGDALRKAPTTHDQVVELGDVPLERPEDRRIVGDERRSLPGAGLDEAADVDVAGHEHRAGAQHGLLDPGSQPEQQDQQAGDRGDRAPQEDRALRVRQQVAGGDAELGEAHPATPPAASRPGA